MTGGALDFGDALLAFDGLANNGGFLLSFANHDGPLAAVADGFDRLGLSNVADIVRAGIATLPPDISDADRSAVVDGLSETAAERLEELGNRYLDTVPRDLADRIGAYWTNHPSKARTGKKWPTAARIARMTGADLVTLYVEASAATEQQTPVRVHNAAADCVARVYRELRGRGVEAQRLLLPLLSDERPGVHGWAASHALEFAPVEAEMRLMAIANTEPFPFGFDAEMVLQEWRAGRLRFS